MIHDYVVIDCTITDVIGNELIEGSMVGEIPTGYKRDFILPIIYILNFIPDIKEITYPSDPVTLLIPKFWAKRQDFYYRSLKPAPTIEICKITGLNIKWFRCPQCQNDEISKASNFCSQCGIKIKWTDE